MVAIVLAVSQAASSIRTEAWGRNPEIGHCDEILPDLLRTVTEVSQQRGRVVECETLKQRMVDDRCSSKMQLTEVIESLRSERAYLSADCDLHRTQDHGTCHYSARFHTVPNLPSRRLAQCDLWATADRIAQALRILAAIITSR